MHVTFKEVIEWNKSRLALVRDSFKKSMKGGESNVDCGWSYPMQDCKGYGSQTTVHRYTTFFTQQSSGIVLTILAMLYEEIGN